MSIMAGIEQVTTTVIVAVTEPEGPAAMLHGSRGSVRAMTPEDLPKPHHGPDHKVRTSVQTAPSQSGSGLT